MCLSEEIEDEQKFTLVEQKEGKKHLWRRKKKEEGEEEEEKHT